MRKISLDQNGSFHLLLICVIVVIVTGGVGYFVYTTQHDKTTSREITNSSKPSITKKATFTSNKEVLDSIGTSIENSSLPVRLVNRAGMQDPLKQFEDISKPSRDTTAYLEAMLFRFAQPCVRTCTTQDNSDDTVKASSSVVSDSTIKLLFSKIQTDLVDHQGVQYVASGDEPGTYVIHHYFILGLTVNNVNLKVQVIFNGGDGGNYISAYIY